MSYLSQLPPPAVRELDRWLLEHEAKKREQDRRCERIANLVWASIPLLLLAMVCVLTLRVWHWLR